MAFTFGGMCWNLLIDTDLTGMEAALDVDGVRAVLCRAGGVATVAEAVAKRARSDRAGESLTFAAVADGRTVGWAGVLPCDDQDRAVQTSTFLHPSVWGSGVNRLAKSLQWETAQALGRYLAIIIDEDNPRSIAAAQKAFPRSTPSRIDGDPVGATVFVVSEPPAEYVALNDNEHRSLEVELRGHPAWARLALATCRRGGCDQAAWPDVL